MVATKEEIAEMEAFFARESLPKEFNINPGIKVLDLPTFINETLEDLKSGDLRDVVIRPRWWDLLEIRKKIQEK